MHGADLGPQPRGQHLVELGERAYGGLAGPGHGAAGGEAERDGGGDGLLVVEQQGRQGHPRAQLVAAADALGGVDRVAQRAQPLDVAAHAAGGHPEPLGQLGAGPHRPLLEQRRAAAGRVRSCRPWSEDATDSGRILSARCGSVVRMTTTTDPALEPAPARPARVPLDGQLRPRLDGLTDDEYLWEPVPGALERPRRRRSARPSTSPTPSRSRRRSPRSRGGSPTSSSACSAPATPSHFGGPPADYETLDVRRAPPTARWPSSTTATRRWVAGRPRPRRGGPGPAVRTGRGSVRRRAARRAGHPHPPRGDPPRRRDRPAPRPLRSPHRRKGSLMSLTIQVTFDCADPAALSRFWNEVLGYRLDSPPPPYETWDEALDAWNIPEENRNDASASVDPEGQGPRLWFQKVPEGKSAKNRVHLDVRAAVGLRGRRADGRPRGQVRGAAGPRRDAAYAGWRPTGSSTPATSSCRTPRATSSASTDARRWSSPTRVTTRRSTPRRRPGG